MLVFLTPREHARRPRYGRFLVNGRFPFIKKCHFQGRSQYEANRGTCLSHLRFDPGSVLFKRSHHKDPE